MATVEQLEPHRAADAALVAELTELINEAYAVGEAGMWVEGTERTHPEEIAAAIRSGGMLAARVDGRHVGAAYVRPLDDTTWDLGFVSAARDQWGGGVGRELAGAAEDLVRSRGAQEMQLELLVPRDWVHPEKDRLRAWYLRLGYEIVRTAPFEEIARHSGAELATPCEFLVFRKALA
jgi:GNAT superfamily N-acetyltransferase